MVSRLTKKQQEFCIHFVGSGVASDAYRRAYDTRNMLPTTIHRKAHDLVNNGKVAATINYMQEVERDRINRTYTVEKDRVIQEYLRLAFIDIRKLFDENGQLRPTDDLDDDVAAAIGSIEVSSTKAADGSDAVTFTTKIKLLDKRQPLQDLAKMLGLFAKDNFQQRDEAKNLQLKVNFIAPKGD